LDIDYVGYDIRANRALHHSACNPDEVEYHREQLTQELLAELSQNFSNTHFLFTLRHQPVTNHTNSLEQIPDFYHETVQYRRQYYSSCQVNRQDNLEDILSRCGTILINDLSFFAL